MCKNVSLGRSLPQTRVWQSSFPPSGRNLRSLVGREGLQRQEVPRARVPGLMPKDCPQSTAKEATAPGSRNKVSLCVPGSPSCTRESSPTRNRGISPLGRTSVTPLPPSPAPARIHPRPDKGGHRWIGFPPLQPSRGWGSLGPGCPSFPNCELPASRST